jgi:hypothetical protein
VEAFGGEIQRCISFPKLKLFGFDFDDTQREPLAARNGQYRRQSKRPTAGGWAGPAVRADASIDDVSQFRLMIALFSFFASVL